MGASRAAERLRRLLVVVPYIVEHQGVEIAEVTRLFDVSEGELLQDLDLLFVTGLPPYGPGDLVDVQIEEGRVWISMADFFSRPVRLTRSEALALWLRGTALLGTPGFAEAPALSSALEKLQQELGDLAERIESAGEGGDEIVAAARDAANAAERIEIEYYSASRGETTTRRVDPEEVFSAIGHWYVVAWDERAGGERMFRTDRIKRLGVTGEHFERRGLVGAGRALYSSSTRDLKVRLRLRPGARWVSDYYEVEDAIERNGSLEVVLAASQLSWIAKLVLGLGEDAEVIEPPELREAVGDLARRALEHYR